MFGSSGESVGKTFKNILERFRRRESDEEIRERLLKLCDGGAYGICPPPMKAQVAVNELCDFFLGRDWYTALSMTSEQVNAEIVYAIETKYKNLKE